jgi:hypothetical protein
MGGKHGEYPVAVVNIPVDDPKTRFVPAALFEPEGAGPFPVVITSVAVPVWVLTQVSSDA